MTIDKEVATVPLSDLVPSSGASESSRPNPHVPFEDDATSNSCKIEGITIAKDTLHDIVNASMNETSTNEEAEIKKAITIISFLTQKIHSLSYDVKDLSGLMSAIDNLRATHNKLMNFWDYHSSLRLREVPIQKYL